MCTVSWRRDETGYELLFNRDELRTRSPALPPRCVTLDRVQVLTPIDADAGGSWLTVNQFGVTVALLNLYQVAGRPLLSGARSRGLLVTDLAPADSLSRALDRLQSRDLSPYPPFTLLLLEASAQPLATVWDGQRLAKPSAAAPPLVSSSFDPAAAFAERRRLWRELVRSPDRDSLLDFHRSHLPARGATSPCMHRDDARTVSATRLRVADDRVEMAYADGPPCRTDFGSLLVLERLHAADAA